jgi:hypothetical protein
MESFAIKTDAQNISLILDAQSLSKIRFQSQRTDEEWLEYVPDGYVCRPKDYSYEENAPRGLKSWPAIFSCPKASFTSFSGNNESIRIPPWNIGQIL